MLIPDNRVNFHDGCPVASGNCITGRPTHRLRQTTCQDSLRTPEVGDPFAQSQDLRGPILVHERNNQISIPRASKDSLAQGEAFDPAFALVPPLSEGVFFTPAQYAPTTENRKYAVARIVIAATDDENMPNRVERIHPLKPRLTMNAVIPERNEISFHRKAPMIVD